MIYSSRQDLFLMSSALIMIFSTWSVQGDNDLFYSYLDVLSYHELKSTNK